VLLDFTSPEGLSALRALVAQADVVVEASRPRALEQLGIDAWSGGARVWVSITGHGRNEPVRVGFGDDAAVTASRQYVEIDSKTCHRRDLRTTG